MVPGSICEPVSRFTPGEEQRCFTEKGLETIKSDASGSTSTRPEILPSH
jgi:hypothetical protein